MTREEKKLRRKSAWMRIAFVLGVWLALAAILARAR